MKHWRRRKTAAIGLGMAVGFITAAVALAGYSAVELSRFERAETRRTVFIHAAGQTLERGTSIRAIDLAGTLARLGYAETRAASPGPGQFRRSPGSWQLSLRTQPTRVRLDLRDGRIARVMQDGREVDRIALEGEVLTGGADLPGEDYRPIRLADVPKVLIDAVLAVEDHRFFQ